ncbi:MAG: hypothetical protein AAFR77_00480 [Cyanobacteria bacterium J06631_2]
MTISPRENKPRHPLEEKSRFSWMPLAIVGTLILNCFLTFKLLGLNKSAVTSRPYIYMQKVDGTTDKAVPMDEMYRSEATIKAYAQDWLKLAYTWRSKNPDLYVVERQAKFPLSLHTASQAIIPGYRETYLDSTNLKYKERFPFDNYISGKYQSYVRVFDQPIVMQVESGVWDVTVIATRTHAQGNSTIAQENFNHTFRIKAIDPGNRRMNTKKDSALEKLYDQMQNQGLQIIDVSQF